MKREILYKAKRVDNGKWVYGYFTFNDETQTAFIFEKGSNLPLMVDVETVCQFTGLTDKNRVKIFEGDKVKQYDSYEPMIYGKIVFRDGCFDIEKTTQEIIFKYYRIESRNIEVIGNIHD